MQRIVLSREWLGQIWVALPVGIRVAVGKSRISNQIRAVIMSHAAMGERIAIRMEEKIPRRCAAGEISFAGRIAPCSGRVPVPRFYVQFRVLPVRNGLPTCGKNLFDHRLNEKLVRSAVRQSVDSRSK